MPRREPKPESCCTTLLLAVALGIVFGGCGTFAGVLKIDATPSPRSLVEPADGPGPAAPAAEIAVADGNGGELLTPEMLTADPPGEPVAEGEIAAVLSSLADEGRIVLTEPLVPELEAASALAQSAQDTTDVDVVDEEYDPWEPFNEKMFAFNRGLDRWVLKPVARGYMFIMPEPWQVMINNGFDNINFVPRFVNSLLQGKWGGAGRELARFLINSTAGIGGLFDPAKDFWGIQKSREDFGQTLGVWGSGPGPYLILPFMEPLTVRDGIGKAIDGFMDPLSYVLPFLWDRLGMRIGNTINERALNYDLFQGFEESVVDMYSAVRHGYLQRRRQLIKE